MRILQRAFLGVAVVALAACGGGGGKQPAPAAGQPQATDESSAYDSSGSASEAERTRAMAGQAAEMNKGFEEARAAGATGADAEAAYQKFEQERARLNQTGEGQQPAPPADQGGGNQ